MKSGIYMLEFPNGEFYIGQSVDIERRIAVHLENLKTGKGAAKLQRLYNQYLYDQNSSISYKTLINVHPDYLDICEAYYIHRFKPTLNTSVPRVHDLQAVEAILLTLPDLPSVVELLLQRQEAIYAQADLDTAKENVDALLILVDELEEDNSKLKALVNDPDAVKLLEELELSKELYRALDTAYRETLQQIDNFNKKSWWERLWTKV